ncbi:MAG: TM2 domain-containing protein [Candidatus Saccharibacteria bacterium]|nr:TM2 domain-containing protein [Candidatus Saccharibacteria bacterium]
MQNTKSATTAGLLGLFLGAFGGHNWYLGDNKKGIIHCSMAGAGILLIIIGNILYNNAISSFSGIMALYGGGFVWQSILMYVGWALVGASEVWGAVEGIQILSAGDAGLAAKGYAVATPQAAYGYNQGYNQGYGPQQGYNQGYGQPMNNGYQNGYPAQNGFQGQPQNGQPYDPGMMQNAPQGPQNAPQGQMGSEMGQNG